MLKLYRDIRALVAAANSIAANSPSDAPRWSIFLTNRSFLTILFAVVLNALALIGVPFIGWFEGVAPEILAGRVVEFVTALLILWAGIERIIGKTRVIWTKRQAKKAVEEAIAVADAPAASGKADKLADAIEAAGVKGVVRP